MSDAAQRQDSSAAEAAVTAAAAAAANAGSDLDQPSSPSANQQHAAASASPPAPIDTNHAGSMNGTSSPVSPLSSPSSDTTSVASPSAASSLFGNYQLPRRGLTKEQLKLFHASWHRKLPLNVQIAFDQVAQFMDGAVVLVIIIVSALITIFLNDIQVSSFPASADPTFANITMFFFVLFATELTINSVVQPGYFLSFFFIMDVVAAFSLLPDIQYVWNPMIGINTSSTNVQDTGNTASEVDAIRTDSNTGTKLLNVLKFVKLVRLGRIAKLFELAQRSISERAKAKRRQNREEEGTAIHAEDYTQSSQVGQSLSEQTTRKVVVLVLLMLLVIPLLELSSSDDAPYFIVQDLASMGNNAAVLGSILAVSMDGLTWSAANSTTDTSLYLYENTFVSSDLQAMLGNYSAMMGQNQSKPTVGFSSSVPINAAYVSSIVPPENYSVALAALNQARALMDYNLNFATGYFGNILYFRLNCTYYYNSFQQPELFTLRVTEMLATDDGTAQHYSVAVFSQDVDAVLSAEYSMWKTFATLIVLTLGALAFDYNNKRMVIEPIERMVATIAQLHKNPLAKAVIENEGEEGAAAEANDTDSQSNRKSNETGMLERTLQKLTALLQVGFGEAGARMIAKCMNQNESGNLEPLVDGSRILAIFGFCDIRRFTDATECLREEVMMYVNEIASIVHSHVSICDGHPNKNVGDAFLVMWRLAPLGIQPYEFGADDLFALMEQQPEYLRPTLADKKRKQELQDPRFSQAERDYFEQKQKEIQEQLLKDRCKQASASYPVNPRPNIPPLALAQLSVLADKATVSLLRIIIDLDASQELRTYENHPRIKAAFDDFRVVLGFGLHCGWAIEGPIGSRYKIDASYLSPHVNLSEALQDLTKQYLTPLLVSGEFYTLLSPYMKSYFRRVDVVKVAGRDIPMNLYAFDVHQGAMRTIIAKKVPVGYDSDADIDVVAFKQSVWTRYQGPLPASASSPSAAGSGGEGAAGAMGSDGEPLSPQSPYNPHADPLTTHALFQNTHLNPYYSDFSNFNYSGQERARIHQMSPVATYHLVYNFRLSALQCGIPYEFHDHYAEGLDYYLNGDWPAAKQKMEQCQELYPEDGPTKVIIDVMKEHNFVAPDDWPGWHEA